MGSLTSRFLLSLALLSSVVGAHSRILSRKPPARAHSVRDSVEQNITSRALEKRFDGARFTFYDAGLGACGRVNSGSDFVVAMNAAQYAGGAHCFQTITITANGKTTSAQVVDLCPGCPFAGLDLSRGLFNFFASESVGVLQGSWNFGGGAPGAPASSKTTSTSTRATTAHPTPTSTPPTTTHTSTTSTSSALTSASTSGSAAPTASSVDATPQINNLEQIYLAFIQIGGVALSASGGSGSTVA